MLFVVMCFLVVVCVLMFSPSLCKLLHLHTNKHIYKHKTHKQLRETNKHKNKHNKQKYIISQPEPERYLFAVGSWAGYPVFLYCYIFLEACLCYLCYVTLFNDLCLYVFA